MVAALGLLIGCCSQGQRGSRDLDDRVPVFGPAANSLQLAPTPENPVDLTPKPLPRIPVRTVIGNGPPPGWSHLVLLATPTLSAQGLRDAPQTAAAYAKMFKFTVLANVVRDNGVYKLQTVARGFAVNIAGRDTIIDGNNTLDADMGLFGKRVLSENEAILDKDVLQVARTETMLVFDAQALLRQNNDHVKMVVRHAIIVDPQTGKLSTLVWLLSKGRPDTYLAAERAMQLLPPNMREERLLSVLRDRFTLGIPSADAFALVRIPQGTAVPYTAQSQALATIKTFTRENVLTLESALRAAVANP